MLNREIHEGSKKFDTYVAKWGANHKAMKKLRSEGNQLVSKLNKRIRRLEKNGYQNLPSLKPYMGDNGRLKQFSIKGKTYNELQQVIAEMRHFENMKTTTTRGVKEWLMNVYESTHTEDQMKKVDLSKISTKKLFNEGKRYFNIYNKLIEYGNTIEGGIAPWVYYKEIFKKINEQIQENKKSLSEMTDTELENMLQLLQDQIDVLSKEQKIDNEVKTNVTDYIWL